MPAGSIQAEDFQITPISYWQGRQHQQPACQIQGVRLKLSWVFACLLALATTRLLRLLLGPPQRHHSCLKALAVVLEEDLRTTDTPRSGSLSFEPLDHIQCFSFLSLHGKGAGGKSGDGERPSLTALGHPISIAIPAIMHINISCLQHKMLQIFGPLGA